MNLLSRATLLAGMASITAGCVANTAEYIPPAGLTNQEMNYSAVVGKSYDDTWSALVRHAAGTFFAIDNFEKESGLLTLSFGLDNPSSFIDCGWWNSTWTDANYQTQSFSGTYVDFLMTYYAGSLTGRMNILVSELDSNQSEVTVNARYILQAPPNSWSFDSGGKAAVRVANASQTVSSPIRTCQPTYRAETEILDAVKAL